jgi:hypothetical protein
MLLHSGEEIRCGEATRLSKAQLFVRAHNKFDPDMLNYTSFLRVASFCMGKQDRLSSYSSDSEGQFP